MKYRYDSLYARSFYVLHCLRTLKLVQIGSLVITKTNKFSEKQAMEKAAFSSFKCGGERVCTIQ